MRNTKNLAFSAFVAITFFTLSLSVVAHAAVTIYQDMSAGFTFYKPNTAVTCASAWVYASPCSLPPENEIEEGVPMAVCGWVGVSPYYDGSDLLVQGGWCSIYDDQAEEFYYFIWTMMSGSDLEFLGWINPGTFRVVTMSRVNNTHWYVYVFGQSGYWIKPQGFPNMYYGHFILGAPEIDGVTAQLPQFDDEHLDLCILGHPGGEGHYGTYYYENGWYVKWIMKQGDYVNTGVEYLLYPEEDDIVHVWWITSKR